MRPGAGEAMGRRSGAAGCWRSGAAAKRGTSGAVKRSSGSGAAGRHRRSAARQTLVRAPCERSLSLSRARAPRSSAKTLAKSGCKNSCILMSEGNLSRGMGSSIPSFQTVGDISKIQVWQSFEIPLKILRSIQALHG